MKKLVSILALTLLAIACTTEEKKPLDGYLINGDAPGIYNGIRVYLQSNDQRNKKVNRDTAIVMNEKFVFEGKVDMPEIYYLSVNSIEGNFPFILENDLFKIRLDKDNTNNALLEGSAANSTLKDYLADTKEVNSKKLKMMAKLRRTKDTSLIKKLNVDIENFDSKSHNIAYNYIRKNKNNNASLIFMNKELISKTANLDELTQLMNGLDSTIKDSKYGLQTATKIEQAKQIKASARKTDIGNIAPQFSAPTPEGKQLSLEEAMGKVTIIDFWASWCGPCRRENPNVVKVYNKYHSKGLEIIGVSLDGNSRQKKPKEAWIKAIAQDKLTWSHVSNLNYFNDPIAKAYNIRSIPATYILDKNGKIVAKNLRGPALEAKIKELLE